MKKRSFLLYGLLLFALVSCENKDKKKEISQSTPVLSNTISPSTLDSDLSTPSQLDNTLSDNSILPSMGDNLTTTEASDVVRNVSIKEIHTLGENLLEDEVSTYVIYAKEITDGNDKLMLFVDDNSYVCVRVSGGFNDYLKNRYKYNVLGRVTKKNGNVEVLYESLTNITTTLTTFDYSSLSLSKNSILDAYDEVNEVKLNK